MSLMNQGEQLIKKFMDSSYPSMKNIPGNKLFYTDNSASTLVWVEDNIVIEHYFLFPNLTTPLHSHPFSNQIIYISGDLTAYRRTEDSFRVKEFTESDIHCLSSILPIGKEHGFRVGANGAIIYNIQIWPDSVDKPVSAAVEYLGKTMGSIHNDLIKSYKG